MCTRTYTGGADSFQHAGVKLGLLFVEVDGEKVHVCHHAHGDPNVDVTAEFTVSREEWLAAVEPPPSTGAVPTRSRKKKTEE